MTISRITIVALIGALVLGALVAGGSVSTVAAASSSEADPTIELSVQQGQESGDDDRVEIMVWTVFASALALSIGLLLFLLRLIMGWVKAPPPPQEEHH
jgi:hypothetical protein